jgi:signal transduction histidine kinase
MARARTAAAAGIPGSHCDLLAVLRPIISALQRLYPDIAFSIETGPWSRESLPMDATDCAELVSNLLDNAGKWASSRVTITLGRSPTELICVADDGPGLSEDQMGQAFEIGARFDPARPGSGLGLAIARDIAQAYGLEVQLASHPDNATGLVASIADASQKQVLVR